MPTSKSQSQKRPSEEKNRRGRLSGKSSSFHGKSAVTTVPELRRPKTVPDLLSASGSMGVSPEVRPRLTKLLLNVTIQRSLGPVQVVMSPDSTVGDLVAAALRQYAKEGRRPILPTADPAAFDLHYSQFSLECLDREAKLMTLGSRNFFLCPKKPAAGAEGGAAASSASCSRQAEKIAKTGFPWLRFMDFLL